MDPGISRVFVVFVLLAFLAMCSKGSRAHDPEHPELNQWFQSLHNQVGMPCCDVSESRAVAADDWKTEGGHYKVLINGEWKDVPDKAVVTEPNRAMRAMVWQHPNYGILCFMPGSMT